MELYQVCKWGVIRHESPGIYTCKIRAMLIAIDSILRERLAHHSYCVVPYVVDATPIYIPNEPRHSGATFEESLEIFTVWREDKIEQTPLGRTTKAYCSYVMGRRSHYKMDQTTPLQYHVGSAPPFCLQPYNFLPGTSAGIVADRYEEDGRGEVAALIRLLFGRIETKQANYGPVFCDLRAMILRSE